MKEVGILIPNYNGLHFMEACMKALQKQGMEYDLLVVDNASTDGSVEYLQKNQIPTIFSDTNLGFAGGVNLGLRHMKNPYIILLNNDTEVFPDFVKQLYLAITEAKDIFSVSPMMIQMLHPEYIDDAGDGLNILGFAYQRGVGERLQGYSKKKEVFSACAGASIYRRDILEEIDYFDEMHFAYLEDIDIGFKARLLGYRNLYEPSAKVYHYGSGTSGSKYNAFKVKLAARNHIYLHYKNLTNVQLVLHFLPLLVGILIKYLFFVKKGFSKEYIDGLKEGLVTRHQCKRFVDRKLKWRSILKVEAWLWGGLPEYMYHFIRRRLDL